jgi:DNA polymerase-3 subunit delta'
MPLRDIAGHRRLIDLLARAVSRGTLPPTLLFAGPSGVGKWHVARALAQAVNCLSPVPLVEGGPAVDACGACRSCDRIARDVHVDVITLAPDDTGVIKIDPVREVLDRCGYRPFEGTRRFVIVRDADVLRVEAQNSLLKSLEEPPAATVFILVSAVPGALLPTVRSRCMRLQFARLTEEDVIAVLTGDHEWSEGEARAAAALADGSPGQALAQQSADLAEARELAHQLLAQSAGQADVGQRLTVARALVGTKPERTRDELAVVLRVAASMLRDLEVLNAQADPRVLANADLRHHLDRLTRAYAGDRARRAFTAVDRALLALNRNASTKVVAEWLATQI